jgi:hypothetical protein
MEAEIEDAILHRLRLAAFAGISDAARLQRADPNGGADFMDEL